MTGSRSLLFALLATLAIGLALFVVFSPADDEPPTTGGSVRAALAGEGADQPAVPTKSGLAGKEFATNAERDRESANAEPSGATTEIEQLASVSLRVLDELDAPIEGARLRGATFDDEIDYQMLALVNWDAPESGQLDVIGEAQSAADGSLQLAVPANRRLVLELSAPGFATAMREAKPILPQQELELGNVLLLNGAELRVEVQDTHGQPIPELGVVAWYGESIPLAQNNAFPMREMTHQLTDENGFAHFRGLPNVPARDIEIWGEKLQSPQRIERLGPPGDEARHLRYILPPANQVAGRVVDASGAGIADAAVIVFDPAFAMRWMNASSEAELEEFLTQRPGFAAEVGDGVLDIFSKLTTDDEGCFEQSYFLDASESEGKPLVFAAIAIVEESIVIESTWHRASDELTLIAPRSQRIHGRVLDSQRVPIQGARIRFEARADAVASQDNEEFPEGVALLDSSPTELLENGEFSLLMPAGNYWAQVDFPGGSHLLEGPYELRNQGIDLGEIIIPLGPSVTLIAQPDEGAEQIAGLRGIRQVLEDEDKDDPFDLGLPELEGTNQDQAWGAQKHFALHDEQDAAIEGLSAHWHNQLEGAWEYVLVAPGWAPAFIEVELSATSTGAERLVPMTRVGELKVQVLTATGEAPENLMLELRPAAELPAHPLYERRNFGRDDDAWYEHDRRTVDRESKAHFEHVLPGSYVLHAMSAAEAENWFGSSNDSQEPIAHVEILAGEITEIDASVAGLAELTVLVMRQGSPVAGAQVYADKLPEGIPQAFHQLSGFSFGGQEPVGVTNAQGRLTVPSLTPNAHYRVGARVPAADSERWVDEDAWTEITALLQPGAQELTIELATGAVRLQVIAATNETVQVQLARTPETAAIDPEASMEEQQLVGMINDHRAQQSQEDLFASSSVAQRAASVGNSIEFLGLPPGEYQVLVKTDSGNARGWSARFQVKDSLVDIGSVQLEQLGLVTIQLLGIDQVNRENRWRFELECMHGESGKRVESTGWLDPSGKQEWYLPTGTYFIQLRSDDEVLGSSPTFRVNSGSTTPFSWQLPELPTGS